MSEYSIGESAARISELIEKAESLKMKALALTDTTLSGSLEFYRQCLKHDIKPLLGQKIILNNSYIILLCKDFEAYRILCRYSLEFSTQDGSRTELPFTKEECTHFICITQQFDSQYVFENFRTNLYLEIRYFTLKQVNSFEASPVQKKLPAVITNPVCFIEKEDNKVLNALKDYREVNFTECNPDHYFVSEDEIKSVLENEHLELLVNTNKIAEKISYIFPENYFEENKCIKRMAENLPLPPECGGTITAGEFLRLKVEENLPKRFETITVEIQERINYELDDIIRRHFEKYFLLHWKIIEECNKLNIAHGPGRGPSSSSLVSYVLGITEINPIEYGLLYERFLNPEKECYPDFDIDFDYERLDDVVQIVKNCYGKESVSRMAAFGRINSKKAFKIAGRALDIPVSEISFITQLYPYNPRYPIERMQTFLKNITKYGYDRVFSSYKEALKLKEIFSGTKYEKLITLAKKLEGLKYTRTLHTCGYIIAKEPVNTIVPVLFDKNSCMVSSQCDMQQLDSYGIYKTDILALKTLTRMRKIAELVEAKKGKEIDISSIPLNDDKTLKLFQKGKTEDIFQFESPGIRKNLRKLKPIKFTDIAALNALYRPGPEVFIPWFIESKLNSNDNYCFDKKCSDITKETYGVIVYQEQVIEIISRVTGCTLGEADLLRRAMGQKKHEIMKQKKKEFVTKAMDKDYSESTAEVIFDILIPFAGYGFLKSHAMAYTKIAWQDAYLKAHYPKEYLEVCRKEYNEEAEVDDEDY